MAERQRRDERTEAAEVQRRRPTSVPSAKFRRTTGSSTGLGASRTPSGRQHAQQPRHTSCITRQAAGARRDYSLAGRRRLADAERFSLLITENHRAALILAEKCKRRLRRRINSKELTTRRADERMSWPEKPVDAKGASHLQLSVRALIRRGKLFPLTTASN